jgi:multiple sugar transport system substrate-binding protein
MFTKSNLEKSINKFSLLVVFGSLLLILSACRPVTSPTLTPTGTPRTKTPTAKAQLTRPKPASTSTITPTPVSSLKVKPSDLKGIILQFWHPWLGEEGDTIRALANKFNASNQWGIIVQVTYQGGYDDIFDKVNTALENSGPPDLAVAYNYQALSWNASNSLVLDLNAYVDDPVWGLTGKEQSDFYSAFWNQDLVGNKRLGIPAQRFAQLIFYNSTWAKELGFSAPPTTPADFREQACAAAKANKQDNSSSNDGTGGWIISTDYSAILGWMDAFGAQVVKPGEEEYQFDTSQVKETFTFLRGLYDEGCAWLTENQNPETDFAGRLGLFATGSVADITSQQDAFSQADSSDRWTVLPFPSSSGKPAIDVYGPSFIAFQSRPAEQLASWLFLKWLVSPEQQAQFIQASGSYSTRASALDLLDTGNKPQWAAALKLIQLGEPEPRMQSWSVVRWAVSDAATQLFRYYFAIDQVPTLTKLLDDTAAELNTSKP